MLGNQFACCSATVWNSPFAFDQKKASDSKLFGDFQSDRHQSFKRVKEPSWLAAILNFKQPEVTHLDFMDVATNKSRKNKTL